MPAVIDTHEYINIEDIETQNLPREQSQARTARPGWWHMLTHGIIAHLTPLPYQQEVPSCSNALRRFETPMDRSVRENPALASYALAIV